MEMPATLKKTNRLVLKAEKARDLMTTNPISVNETATLKEAVAFLTDKGFSAAPVVDEAGRPVGVLSQTDIVIHDRNQNASTADYYAKADLGVLPFPGPPTPGEGREKTMVRDIMTPVVLWVAPDDPITRVVGDMVAMKVHRLFVVDDDVLVGVISAFDVLRKLGVEK